MQEKNRPPCLPQAGGIRWTKQIIPFGRLPAADREFQNFISGNMRQSLSSANRNISFLTTFARTILFPVYKPRATLLRRLPWAIIFCPFRASKRRNKYDIILVILLKTCILNFYLKRKISRRDKMFIENGWRITPANIRHSRGRTTFYSSFPPASGRFYNQVTSLRSIRTYMESSADNI